MRIPTVFKYLFEASITIAVVFIIGSTTPIAYAAAPTVNISSPIEGAVIEGSDIYLQIGISGGITCRLILDGGIISIPCDTGNIQISPGVGNHTVEIQGINMDGTGSATVHVTNIPAPTPVSSCEDLADINNDLSGSYRVTTDLDCTADGNAIVIGSGLSPFTGEFDGDGHTITVTISMPTDSAVGLFGYVVGASIYQLSVRGAIEGGAVTGGIVGYAFGTVLSKLSSAVHITSTFPVVGGIVGLMDDGTLTDSYFTGVLNSNDSDNGSSNIGGIAGQVQNGATISRVYVSGAVRGTGVAVGGIVGLLDGSSGGATLEDSFMDGFVYEEGSRTGAVVGSASQATLTNIFYDQTIAKIGWSGDQDCVSFDDSSSIECEPVNSDGLEHEYFYGTATNGPLSTWDFYDAGGNPSGTWHVNENGLPTLFNLAAPPAVLSSDPSSLSTAGGDDLIFHGTYFAIGSVAFDDVDQTIEDTNADTDIEIITSAHATGTVRVTITNEDGQLTTYPITYADDGGDDQGDGSSGNPFHVDSCEALAAVNYVPSAYFILTDDLDCTAAGNMVMIGGGDDAFSGYFDGGGHTITVALADEDSDIALFQVVNGGIIHDLRVAGTASGINNIAGIISYGIDATIYHVVNSVNVTAYGDGFTGGLAGQLVTSTVHDVYNDGDVDVQGGGAAFGGLIGYQNGGTVSNAYSVGTLTGSAYNVGGLIGSLQGSVDHSFAAGAITATGINVGGFAGYAIGTLADNYWDSTISGTSVCAYDDNATPVTSGCTGESDSNAFKNNHTNAPFTVSGTPYWDFEDVWSTTSEYPVLQSVPVPDQGGGGGGSDPTDDYVFEFGTGTTEDPYSIRSCEALQAMRQDLSAHYLLGAEIDCTPSRTWYFSDDDDEYQGFEPVGNDDTPFTGTFDGDGYVISNLFIQRRGDHNVGLFGTIDNAQIGLASITNSRVFGYIHVGGIVGHMLGSDSVIRNSSFNVGTADNDCNAETGHCVWASLGLYGGGIVGLLENGLVTGTQTAGPVKGSGSNIGGLIGGMQGGFLLDSHTSSNTDGGTAIGGAIGEVWGGMVSNVYATGNQDANQNEYFKAGTKAGGFVGYMHGGTIVQSYATGNASARDYGAGGFVGYMEGGAIVDSYAAGNAAAASNLIGGFVGALVKGTISRAYATGSVSSENDDDTNIGGFAGYVGADAGEVRINDSFSAATIAPGDSTPRVGFAGRVSVSNELILSNNAYDASRTDSAICYRIFAGENVAESPDCQEVNIEGSQPGYFFADDTAQTSYWNYTNVWHDEAEDYPTLQMSAFNPDATTIITGAAYSIDDHSATAEVGIPILGGHQILTSVIVYSTDPDLQETGSVSGEGHRIDPLTITGLACNTRYYYSAYGIDESENAYYGATLNFLTAPCEETYPFTSGDGGGQDPYEIDSCESLQAIGTTRHDGGSYFYLSGDLTCNDFEPITDPDDDIVEDTHFDGRGNTLTLTLGASAGYAGLFQALADSYIHDLRIAGDITSETDGTGAVAGYADTTTVERVWVSASVSGNNNVGGIFGYSGSQISIIDSMVTGAITASGGNAGGFIGYATGGSIQTSYSIGQVIGNEYVGGLVGFHSNYLLSITNSFADGLVSPADGAEYTGGLLGLVNLDTDDIDNAWYGIGNTAMDHCATALGEGPYVPGENDGVVCHTTEDGDYFENTTTNAPLDTWNFDDVWILTEGYPRLRTFTHVQDTTPPSVIETSIANNAAGVPLDTDYVYFTFSESFNFGSIDVSMGPCNSVCPSLELGGEGHDLAVHILSPQPLLPGVNYTITLSHLEDQDGNMADNYVLSFTTAGDLEGIDSPTENTSGHHGGSRRNSRLSSSSSLSPSAPTSLLTNASSVPASDLELSCGANIYPTQSIRLGAQNDPAQVRLLENYLNTYEGTHLPVDGIYDSQDAAAIVAWQEKYASEILAPWNLTKGTGYLFTTSLLTIKEHFMNQCQAPISPSPSFKTLRFGMTDPLVMVLQRYLNMHGFPLATSGAGAPGFETEVFADRTQAAVLKFQHTNALPQDGIVTAVVWAAMK